LVRRSARTLVGSTIYDRAGSLRSLRRCAAFVLAVRDLCAPALDRACRCTQSLPPSPCARPRLCPPPALTSVRSSTAIEVTTLAARDIDLLLSRRPISRSSRGALRPPPRARQHAPRSPRDGPWRRGQHFGAAACASSSVRISQWLSATAHLRVMGDHQPPGRPWPAAQPLADGGGGGAADRIDLANTILPGVAPLARQTFSAIRKLPARRPRHAGDRRGLACRIGVVR